MANDTLGQIQRLSESLTKIVTEFENGYDRLAGVRINPSLDYSKEGVAALFGHVVEARAQVDFASHEMAALRRKYGRAKSALAAAQELFQHAYDAAVVFQTRSGSLNERMSWEERASWVRTAVIDEVIALRRCERLWDQIEALLDACKVLMTNIERARYDLSAATEVLKLGSTLGELPE